jgi:thiamine-monophosphate kinase
MVSRQHLHPGGAMSREESIEGLGEFGLIDRIGQLVGPSEAVVGIGDDAAVLDLGEPDYLLATVDMLVERIHFPQDADARDLGRRALAVNLSDIAAMGGIPRFALVSLALPEKTPKARVERLFEGLRDEGNRYGVSIVGGNITSTPGPLAIDVTLLGRVPRDEVLLRSGARPGDLLVVSGTLGQRAAQRLLHDRVPSAPPPGVPEPRIGLGRALAAAGLAHAAIDISDGVGSDLHHLASRSGVGALVEGARLPISGETQRAAGRLWLDPLQLALFGGEDYELLLAIPPDRLDAAIDAAGAVPLRAIGQVTARGAGVVLQSPNGESRPLEARGWKHF